MSPSSATGSLPRILPVRFVESGCSRRSLTLCAWSGRSRSANQQPTRGRGHLLRSPLAGRTCSCTGSPYPSPLRGRSQWSRRRRVAESATSSPKPIPAEAQTSAQRSRSSQRSRPWGRISFCSSSSHSPAQEHSARHSRLRLHLRAPLDHSRFRFSSRRDSFRRPRFHQLLLHPPSPRLPFPHRRRCRLPRLAPAASGVAAARRGSCPLDSPFRYRVRALAPDSSCNGPLRAR
mmetsp:Transcript_28924/g.73134  ORF Transcript_28924/g.73134 Transcript_28924/m.73134 type:complete len:233 (-) Transcript_28924:324-1022(-)